MKAKTLDDYLPQIYCAEFVPVGTYNWTSSTNFYNLCDKKVNHKGECSSAAARYYKDK